MNPKVQRAVSRLSEQHEAVIFSFKDNFVSLSNPCFRSQMTRSEDCEELGEELRKKNKALKDFVKISDSTDLFRTLTGRNAYKSKNAGKSKGIVGVLSDISRNILSRIHQCHSTEQGEFVLSLHLSYKS